MQNSLVIFSGFVVVVVAVFWDQKSSFGANLGQKNRNFQFKLKFGT